MATYKTPPKRKQRNGPPALGPQQDGKAIGPAAGPMGTSVAGQVGRAKVGALTGTGKAAGGGKIRPQRG